MSPNNENNTDSPNSSSSESLLGKILWSEGESREPTVDLLSDSFVAEENKNPIPPVSWTVSLQEAVKKSPKKPMSAGAFLRMVWAILLVAFIFFGAFLAYIVFNPGQAVFFISFGINPGDIAQLLKQLVSIIFGAVTFLLSVVWIVYLFRAILTKKEYKKKKTISIILSGFFGILLFSEITLWAFLVQQINATDYKNPNGGVVVYDNEKFISERFKDIAQMNNFDNLIGPLELRFDLESNANLVGKLIDIESFKIDFDGAKCQWNGSSIVNGVSAEQSIICVFDTARVFKPTGIYEGYDRVTREPQSISIDFQPIQIAGVVEVKKTKTSFTYDASSLASLGGIAWLTEKDDNLTKVSSNAIFSMTIKNDDQILCLNISSGMTCDKLFIISKGSESNIVAKILYEQNKENPRKYAFSLEIDDIKSGEITGYQWMIDNLTVSREEKFLHEFTGYGDVKVKVLLTDSTGNITELNESFSMMSPLKLTKGTAAESLLKIIDTSGESLMEKSYNASLKAYYITEVIVPMNIQLDATDVKVENYGYELTGVEWDLDEDGAYEKTGNRIKTELIEMKRYTFSVRYTFTNSEKNITATLSEKVIFEPEKRDIALTLKLTQDSEYAPATIHVDGSASIPKEGKIVKFMYDFGEGRGPIEWDAIQDYRYIFPGEYTITFIVVRDDGTKEQSSRKIILKDIPKRVVINTSVSSGKVGKPIDFDTNGSVGQIEYYSWDFWDGTSSQEPAPIHTYLKEGKFTVKVTATYTDRTMRSTDKEISVTE